MAFENYGNRNQVTLPAKDHVTPPKPTLRNNDQSNVTKEIKKRVEAESAKVEVKKKKSRAGYMREYRSRPKKCPHCGKQI